MYAALLVLALAAAAAQTASPQPRDPADERVERVRAALEKPPSKLTLPEVKPDFKVHIEERRPPSTHHPRLPIILGRSRPNARRDREPLLPEALTES